MKKWFYGKHMGPSIGVLSKTANTAMGATYESLRDTGVLEVYYSSDFLTIRRRRFGSVLYGYRVIFV